MLPLTIFVVEIIAIQSALLLFFRSRHTLSLVPLYVCLGVLQVLQTLSATIIVDIGFDIKLSFGSSILFTASLCMVLLVYIREDALEARKLIYALVGSNILSGLLMLSIEYQMRSGIAVSLLGLPVTTFSQNAKVLLFGTMLLYVDAILIPFLYEVVSRRVGNLFVKMVATMAVVLVFDSLVFLTALFYSEAIYTEILRSSILGKLIAAVCYCALITVHLKYFDHKSLADSPKTASRDMFEILTYRERFEALQTTAARDGLTGVFNRSYFDTALEAEWQRSSRSRAPVSLILVDLDHFKALNDRHGHVEGDRCLKIVGHALQVSLHRSTDLAARYGGEEFAILLPATDQAGAKILAEQIRLAIVELGLKHDAHPLGRVTASLGVATMTGNTSQAAVELVRRADEALYRAKAHGRNCVEVA